MTADAFDTGELWSALEAAAEQLGLGLYIARLDATPPYTIRASARAGALVGYAPSYLEGKLPWMMLDAADQTRIRELISSRDASVPITVSVDITRPDGTRVPLEVGISRITTSAGSISVGYMRDLSAEHRAREVIAQGEQQFRTLVEAAPDGVVILQRGRVAMINPKACELLGVEAVAAIGRSVGDFLPPEDARRAGERIGLMMRTGAEYPPSDYGVLADPRRVVEIKSVMTRWQGEPAVLAFARDVTERNALRARLVQADRLSALGTLSAGVAHEINNPLTYAQLSLERIEREIKAGGAADALRPMLHDVGDALTRIAGITRALRSFARPDEAPPGAVDLAAAIASALKLIDNELRHRARVVRHLAEVPAVHGNASRLEQVIVNLVLNALSAVKSAPEPTIELAVALRDRHVVLAVHDNGHGIADHVLARVFDPFFTTKPFGEGLGIGLAVSRNIVESFGGRISIVSEPGVGTRVEVTLELAGETHEAPVMDRATAAGRKRILIIDDEPLVRTVLGGLLAEEHDVVVVPDGRSGIEKALTTPFDVIVCDVMMPGCDGREIHTQLAAGRPGLERRIVFITGGTFTRDLDDFLMASGSRCIPKPFRIDAIREAIENVGRS